MSIEGVQVNNLCENVKDGIILNKVLTSIDAKSVDWRLIKIQPRHEMDRNLNND